MGLDLSKKKGSFRNEAEEEQKSKSAFDQVEEIEQQIFAKMKLHPYAQPSKSPADLSQLDVNQLSNADLSTIYSQYTAYAAYLMTQASKTKSMLTMAKSNLTRLGAQIKADLYSKNVPKDEIAVAVKTDGLYQDAELEYHKQHIMNQIISAYYRAYDMQSKALSRVVEIRKMEFQQGQRDHHIQNHRIRLPSHLGKKGAASRG